MPPETENPAEKAFRKRFYDLEAYHVFKNEKPVAVIFFYLPKNWQTNHGGNGSWVTAYIKGRTAPMARGFTTSAYRNKKTEALSKCAANLAITCAEAYSNKRLSQDEFAGIMELSKAAQIQGDIALRKDFKDPLHQAGYTIYQII